MRIPISAELVNHPCHTGAGQNRPCMAFLVDITQAHSKGRGDLTRHSQTVMIGSIVGYGRLAMGKKPPGTMRMNVVVPKEIHTGLKVEAAKRGYTLNKMVVTALRAVLRNLGSK